MAQISTGAQFAEIPIFPLPRVVLFPGAMLPLHVFEPRYRSMTEAALSSNRLICMINVLEQEPSDALGHPAIAALGGLGEIIEHERLPDGRFHLLLMGRYRVNVQELAFRPPFRRGCASVLSSVGDEPSDIDRTVLRSAMRQRITRLREADPEFEFDYPEAVPTSQLVDFCGQYLIREHQLRQELLETLNIKQRLDRCVTALLKEAAPQPGNLN